MNESLPFVGEVNNSNESGVHRLSRVRDDGLPFGMTQWEGMVRHSKNEFATLNEYFLAFVGSLAGLGHYTPLLASLHAFSDIDIPRAYASSVATDLHAVGSSGWGQEMTLHISRYPQAQLFVDNLDRNFIYLQKERILKPIHEVIQLAKQAKKEKVLLVFTHPEAAMALAMTKGFLESFYQISITTALILCDHFPTQGQIHWSRPEVDMLLVPDSETYKTVEKEMMWYIGNFAQKFNHDFSLKTFRPPLVTNMLGFPIEQTLARKLQEEEWLKRKKRLSRDMQQSPFIEIPLGGSLPQRELIKSIVRHLSLSEKRIAADWTCIFKRPEFKREDRNYERWIRKMEKLEVTMHEEKTSDATIDTIHQYLAGMKGRLVDILLTKPSEKVNIAMLTPRQAGGPILVLLPPVGQQEEQNLAFLRSEAGGKVLLAEAEEKELYVLLRLRDNAYGEEAEKLERQLNKWRKRATKLRAISVPDSGPQAGEIIYLCKKYGIFEAMADYEEHSLGSEMNADSVTQLPLVLDQSLRYIEEMRQEGRRLFVPPVPVFSDGLPADTILKYILLGFFGKPITDEEIRLIIKFLGVYLPTARVKDFLKSRHLI